MAYQAIPPSGGWQDVWASNQQNFLRSLGLGLTRFEYIKLGEVPLGTGAATAIAGDSAIEGGAEQGITTTVLRYFTNGIFQTLKTGKWAISWRGKIAAPVSGRSANAGFINAAANHGVYVRTDFAVDATKWLIQYAGAGVTNNLCGVADNSKHTFSLTGDATNIRFYVDNVVNGTAAIDANVTDESMFFFLSASTLADCYGQRAVYGYIDP